MDVPVVAVRQPRRPTSMLRGTAQPLVYERMIVPGEEEEEQEEADGEATGGADGTLLDGGPSPIAGAAGAASTSSLGLASSEPIFTPSQAAAYGLVAEGGNDEDEVYYEEQKGAAAGDDPKDGPDQRQQHEAKGYYSERVSTAEELRLARLEEENRRLREELEQARGGAAGSSSANSAAAAVAAAGLPEGSQAAALGQLLEGVLAKQKAELERTMLQTLRTEAARVAGGGDRTSGGSPAAGAGAAGASAASSSSSSSSSRGGGKSKSGRSRGRGKGDGGGAADRDGPPGRSTVPADHPLAQRDGRRRRKPRRSRRRRRDEEEAAADAAAAKAAEMAARRRRQAEQEEQERYERQYRDYDDDGYGEEEGEYYYDDDDEEDGGGGGGGGGQYQEQKGPPRDYGEGSAGGGGSFRPTTAPSDSVAFGTSGDDEQFAGQVQEEIMAGGSGSGQQEQGESAFASSPMPGVLEERDENTAAAGGAGTAATAATAAAAATAAGMTEDEISQIDTVTADLLQKSRQLLGNAEAPVGEWVGEDGTNSGGGGLIEPGRVRPGKRNRKKKTKKKAKTRTQGEDIIEGAGDEDTNYDDQELHNDGGGPGAAGAEAGGGGEATAGLEDEAAAAAAAAAASHAPHRHQMRLDSMVVKKANSVEAAMEGLGSREWENEIAANILTIYEANMNSPSQAALMPKDGAGGMVKSSSLPRIGKAMHASSSSSSSSLSSTGGGSRRGGKRALGGTRGSSTKKHQPQHIWFSGTGSVRAVWCGLAMSSAGEAAEELSRRDITCRHKLCGELRTLEEKGRFHKYVAIVEGMLTARNRIFGTEPAQPRQWRQLTVCANVFGMKYTDRGKHGHALEMLKRAERYSSMEMFQVSEGEKGGGKGKVWIFVCETCCKIHQKKEFYRYGGTWKGYRH